MSDASADRLFRAAVESSPNGVVMVDEEGRIVLVNRETERLFGFSRSELVGQSVEILVPIPARGHHSAQRTSFGDHPRPRPMGMGRDLQARRKDGTEFPVEIGLSPIETDAGAFVLASIVDIGPRKRAEEEVRRSNEQLRASEERFRQLAENIKEALIVADLPGFEAVYLSRMWSEIWGRPLEDEYRHSGLWFQSIHEEDRQGVLAGQRAVLDGAPATSVFRILRPEGSIRWVRSRIFPVLNERHEVYRMVGLVEDITEIRETEEQLRQAQKMEAVGRLAGGVAHDFNNLLTAILGFGELALEELGSNVAAADVREMVSAARSAEHLTRQLLAFSRRQILQPQNLLLNDVVRRTQSLLQRVIGEDVELHLNLAEPLGSVNADPGQIEQVIMNLAVNARDAMPEGGHLTIETANVSLDQEYAARHAGASAGAHVMLAMSDTGVGIDPAIRDRIFEPFFTTKETGKGTGLGLATVYGVVKQSKGSIWVYSEVGVGTTFKIYLPMGEQAVDRDTGTRPESGSVPANETILVVEDQVETRAIICTMLRRRGYRVLEAASGADAVDQARLEQGAIHVLLTDVVMPGMGGRDVAGRLCSMRPELRVIYMSGYTDDSILRHGIVEEGLSFLQKPFTGEALFRKVREVLERR